MFLHYNNGKRARLIRDILSISVIDGNEPVIITLRNGAELRTRIDRIEMIVDDEALGDVQTVRHGGWLGNKCSICGGLAPYYPMSGAYRTTNYCPRCGAKMDRSGDNAEIHKC